MKEVGVDVIDLIAGEVEFSQRAPLDKRGLVDGGEVKFG
jgi:hypothetical protein